MRYFAIKPKGQSGHAARIERAATASQAADQAFGKGTTRTLPGVPAIFHAKDLGTSISTIRSDRQRIELLMDPEGWIDL